MTSSLLSPPVTAPEALVSAVQRQGYAVLDRAGWCQFSGCAAADLLALNGSWQDLPADGYLKDGGRYRRRRHCSFVLKGDQLSQVPHRAHWQPLEYNALHGGLVRWFEPMLDGTVAAPVWQQMLLALGRACSAVRPGATADAPWFIEAHQFRIDTTDGIGRPTPEGAHRDGVDLVAVFLVDRQGIKGGESRVFDADGPNGQRFTLTEPWSLLLLDDERVIHESTPIQPLTQGGWRDTLVLTFRRQGFQDERAGAGKTA